MTSSSINIKLPDKDRFWFEPKPLEIEFHPELSVVNILFSDSDFLQTINSYSYRKGNYAPWVTSGGTEIDQTHIQHFAFSRKYNGICYVAYHENRRMGMSDNEEINKQLKQTEYRTTYTDRISIYALNDSGQLTLKKMLFIYGYILSISKLCFSPIFPLLLIQSDFKLYFYDLTIIQDDDTKTLDEVILNIDGTIVEKKSSNLVSGPLSHIDKSQPSQRIIDNPYISVAFHPTKPIFAVNNLEQSNNVDVFSYTGGVAAAKSSIKFEYCLLFPYGRRQNMIQTIKFHSKNNILACMYESNSVIQLFNLDGIQPNTQIQSSGILFATIDLGDKIPISIDIHPSFDYMVVTEHYGYIQLFHLDLVKGPTLKMTLRSSPDARDIICPGIFHPTLLYFSYGIPNFVKVVDIDDRALSTISTTSGAVTRALIQNLSKGNPTFQKMTEERVLSKLSQLSKEGPVVKTIIESSNPELLKPINLTKDRALHEPVLKSTLGNGGSKTKHKSKSTKKRGHNRVKKHRRHLTRRRK